MWPAIIQQLSEQLGKDFHLVEKELACDARVQYRSSTRVHSARHEQNACLSGA
ncbi:Fructosamine kinase family-like protein [Vibrio cholerae]|nr:Fructosamine kinase family-like protein [Vibrio cholerae]